MFEKKKTFGILTINLDYYNENDQLSSGDNQILEILFAAQTLFITQFVGTFPQLSASYQPLITILNTQVKIVLSAPFNKSG